MKKIITGACILLVAVMFSPAMAQDGPNERLDRQGDRNGKRMGRNSDLINTKFDYQNQRSDRRIDHGKNHWRGQRSTRFANPRGHRGNHKYTRHNNRHRRQMYSRYNNRHRRQMYSRYNNRHRRHMYSRFNNRNQRHLYSRPNNGQYRHRKNW